MAVWAAYAAFSSRRCTAGLLTAALLSWCLDMWLLLRWFWWRVGDAT